jgi:hypothetical protein
MNTLFNQPLKVVNVGLQSFASNIQKVGGEVIALSWQPLRWAISMPDTILPLCCITP